MKTTKTTTINGTRYTATKLRKLAAQNGIETNGGDTLVELEPGVEACLTEYKLDNALGVRNYGGCQRKGKSFGDLIAILG